MPEYLRLHGDISEGDCSAAAVAEALQDVPATASITVSIHSRGGDYFDGVAIYNQLSKYRDVTVHVEGLAASAASYICMAAKQIIMRAGARLMVHSPMASARGNTEQIMTTLNVLKELEAEMAVVYAERSNLTALQMLALMRAETWFTGEEAAKVFRGVKVDEMKVAASISPEWLGSFSNIPLDLAVDMHVAASKPRPRVDAATAEIERARRARRRKRMMIIAFLRKPDAETAKRQRQRQRLEMKARLIKEKIAADAEQLAKAKAGEAAIDAAQRKAARAADEREYYARNLGIPKGQLR